MRILGSAAVALLVASATPASAANDPGSPHQWGMRLIGAERAWPVATGQGTTIAVVDTGVDADHQDLRGKVLVGRNFVTEGAPADDDNGHGTHVAGIAAASTNNGLGVVGTAPGARILPVKVLDADSGGQVTDLTDVPAGIRWAADNGAHVINVSLTLGRVAVNATSVAATGPTLAEAARYAWSKGSIVVVSAGNDETATNLFGNEPVIVVTATDDEDRKAPYATRVGAARWGMAAPGGYGEGPDAENILSTYWAPGSHETYAWAAGTSMAAPHVAGAAAVLRSQGLSKQQAVDRLLRSAEDLGSPGPDSTFGAGRLDLGNAVGLGPTSAQNAAGGTNTTATTRRTGGGPTSSTARAGTGTLPATGGESGDGSRAPVDDHGLAVVDADKPGGGFGGTEPADHSAGARGNGRSQPGTGDRRPWAAAALAAGLLAVAGRAIVRARRA